MSTQNRKRRAIDTADEDAGVNNAVDGDEAERRRAVEVLRLVAPLLMKGVSDIITKDGKLQMEGVFTRQDIPNLVYVLKAGVPKEIKCIGLGTDGFIESSLVLSEVADVELLCSCLSTSSLPRLRELGLDDCHLTDAGFEVLATTLQKQCPKLTWLACRDNNMSSAAEVHITEWLKASPGLTIFLSRCHLSSPTCDKLKREFGDSVYVDDQETD